MFDIWDKVVFYLERGGIVMPALVLSAALLWYGLGFRFFALRRGDVRSVRVLVERYRHNDHRTARGIIDAAILRSLAIAQRGCPSLRRKLDEELGEFDEQLNRFRTSTRTIVVLAPLLGLLGTVIGMVETFESLGDLSLFAQSGGVAGGISQALFSTQFGLAVAVPGLIAQRISNRRQELLEMELLKIKDIVCSQTREAQL